MPLGRLQRPEVLVAPRRDVVPLSLADDVPRLHQTPRRRSDLVLRFLDAAASPDDDPLRVVLAHRGLVGPERYADVVERRARGIAARVGGRLDDVEGELVERRTPDVVDRLPRRAVDAGYHAEGARHRGQGHAPKVARRGYSCVTSAARPSRLRPYCCSDPKVEPLIGG